MAAAAASTMAMAGGAIAPVEVVAPVIDDSGFYLGLGYGFGTTEVSVTDGYEFIADSIDTDNIALQAGYNFNKYVAVEGRYNIGLENDDYANAGIDSASLYVKPQYPVSDAMSIYALVGYSWNTLFSDVDEDTDADGFAYGIGAKYEVVENVEVFADYTSVYSDTETYGDIDIDEDIYNVTIGATYKF